MFRGLWRLLGGTSSAGGALSAEAAGNSRLTLVPFSTASQAWETLAAASTLWRLVGSQANGEGGKETHPFAGKGL